MLLARLSSSLIKKEESLNGLHPLTTGARVSFSKEKPTVIDGCLLRIGNQANNSRRTAHRLSTLKRMDRILVFENGCIVEDGSPKALLKNPEGRFSTFWKMQSEGFIQTFERDR